MKLHYADMSDLRKDIEAAINRHSAENGSNTPDFILAEFLTDSLAAFDKAANARRQWYGDRPGLSATQEVNAAPE